MAVSRRVAATGPYQSSHEARRSVATRSSRPATRTSLPGEAVVPTVKRWSARRRDGAPASSARRSTAGRHDEAMTVGTANSASRSSTGLTAASSTRVITRRSTQPAVVKTDMYRWSRTKTWLRSTDSRSSSSGRSWWAMVTTEACRWATWDSRAMVIRSRNRRWTRVDTVMRNQVATPAAPSSRIVTRTVPSSPARRASASTAKPTASIASGTAASSARPKATTISAGSCW